MNATTRLAGFGVALVAILGVGAGLGAAVGPEVGEAGAEAPAPIGQGVVAAAEGYRLIPANTELDRDGGTFRFAIEDQNDQAVHEFTPIHERDLHLIVVNRELTTFLHVHPTLDVDGTWSDRPPRPRLRLLPGRRRLPDRRRTPARPRDRPRGRRRVPARRAESADLADDDRRLRGAARR